MRRTPVVVLLVTMVAAGAALAQESPCQGRVVKICEGADAAGNPICRLLKLEDPESPASVFIFLVTLGRVDESERQDLICARLVGRKTIEGFFGKLSEAGKLNEIRESSFVQQRNSVDLESGRNYTLQEVWRFDLQPPEPFRVFREKVAKLARLGDLVDYEMHFELTGFVSEVRAEYSGKRLLRYEVEVTSAEIHDTVTAYAVGDLAAQSAAIQEKINERLKALIKAGLPEDSSEQE